MFCINYYPSQDFIQNADQFKIKYRPADRTLEDFVKKYCNKTIIIDVSDAFDDTDAKLLKGLYEQYKNIKIIFDFENKDFLSKAEKYELPYFFTNSCVFIECLPPMQDNTTNTILCGTLIISSEHS